MARKLSGKLGSLATSKKQENLTTLSPKLSNHHWYGSMDNYIELPGQYTGKAPPNPSTSLKIVKFAEELTIIKSLRMPIKISCICSDGKSYSFIVKYEEDLRRDERIQHVQGLMSEQMQLDKNCSHQNLSLRTYQVIPLNTECGLIQCIENTENIHSFLSKDQKDKKWCELSGEARALYANFINNGAKDIKKDVVDIVKALLVYSHDQVSRTFKRRF